VARGYTGFAPVWWSSGDGGRVEVPLRLPPGLRSKGGHVVVFVRAHLPGQPLLSGVSTRRIFQFRLKREP
jgi:hypothetical protein